MSSKDARLLSSEAQEALWARMMVTLRGGMKPAVAARTLGVSRSSVWNWRRRVALGNITSLQSKKRGRPKGIQLAPHEAATFFLPGYSPDLNPDEFLNQDVKSNTLGRRRPVTQSERIRDVRAYLRSTQCQPEIVQSYFRAKSVRYAAA